MHSKQTMQVLSLMKLQILLTFTCIMIWIKSCDISHNPEVKIYILCMIAGPDTDPFSPCCWEWGWMMDQQWGQDCLVAAGRTWLNCWSACLHKDTVIWITNILYIVIDCCIRVFLSSDCHSCHTLQSYWL